MNKIRKLAFSAVTACAIAAPGVSSAGTIQLGFILDDSGSIGGSGWSTIVNGLSSAVNSIPVGGTDQYEVTVVKFASGASTVVDRVLLTDAATRTGVANTIAAEGHNGGGTNFGAAFGEMFDTLTAGGASLLDSTYLNFATDGSGIPGTTEVAQLIAAGVDNISVEGIGVGVNEALLKSDYCYPGPCTTFPTVNFPSQGFYIPVADAQGYAAAIGEKIGIVTGGGSIPEPGTLALFALGLAGLGFASRRKAA